MSANNEKSRYWAFIWYPEDTKIKDYKQYFEERSITAVISPLHDMDINEGTGEKKKPHRHILLLWDGPTTFNVVKKITDDFGSPIPIKQNDIKNAVRYLTHKNNPEKAQYSDHDIELVGIHSINEIVELSQDDIRKLWVIIHECVDRGIYEYGDLMTYALNNDIQLFNYVSTHTIAVNTFITSKRNKQKTELEMQSKKLDIELKQKMLKDINIL